LEAAIQTSQADDAVLVRQMQDGQQAAFPELVRRYQDRVYNAVWRITGHVEDARDVTQDAFLKAYRSIESFRGESGFYTWIFRIAVNLAISHQRSHRRRRMQSLDSARATDFSGSQAASLAARIEERNASNPSGNAVSQEMHSHVAEALMRIDAEYRTVIVLRDIEGLDYRQIAEVLKVATGTVKSRLHRGRLALREILAPILGRETQ
jgi:RNA polymerase sigma-70 factor (ECF subfamily)